MRTSTVIIALGAIMSTAMGMPLAVARDEEGTEVAEVYEEYNDEGPVAEPPIVEEEGVVITENEPEVAVEVVETPPEAEGQDKRDTKEEHSGSEVRITLQSVLADVQNAQTLVEKLISNGAAARGGQPDISALENIVAAVTASLEQILEILSNGLAGAGGLGGLGGDLDLVTRILEILQELLQTILGSVLGDILPNIGGGIGGSENPLTGLLATITDLLSGLGSGGAPGLPELPDVPSVPEIPGIPQIPGVPETPSVPTIPGLPDLEEFLAGIPAIGGDNDLLNTLGGLLGGGGRGKQQ